ncbi:hypothetical protein HPC49_35930 [Pyxidicoccus fallax]|uniref:Lipoprotein n=1 Tax=Pyxidicoccus fallax TaxID=394095 RepID=A0A848LWQ5_9BACT|nr:hypothetical protein [Pyxidicoccus fallax]NMO22069.1 hypothetical protein [Pyxidicoccus fallax]NPC83601.1 hypothetical protein [Pyxidicoccus fallax]
MYRNKAAVSTPWLSACIAFSLASLVGCGGGEGTAPVDAEGNPTATARSAKEEAALARLFPGWGDLGRYANDPQFQHATPKVPIVVDGVRLPPEAIQRFNGQPVIYLMNEESQEGGFVYVFSTHQKLRAHLEARGKMPRLDGGDVSAMDETPAIFYADPGLTGWEIRFSRGTEVPNLTSHSVNWFWNWNDQISSLAAANVGTYTVLYQNSNYWGTEVWTAAGTSRYDLGWINYDNQASSIRVLP